MAVPLKTLLNKTQLLHPDEIEDKTCPVCLEDYLQDHSREFPRKLPCGHLIGTECLLSWASSQAHAASINCPWCTRAIIHTADERCLRKAAIAYVRVVFRRFAERIQGVHDVLHRQHWSVLVFADIVSSLGWRYFESYVVLFPFVWMGVHARVAIEHRLESSPRFGIVLMVLGFCVGTFCDKRVGRSLISCGESPFEVVIYRAYRDRMWLVLGLSVAGLAVQAFWEHPAMEMIKGAALRHFIFCVGYGDLYHRIRIWR